MVDLFSTEHPDFPKDAVIKYPEGIKADGKFSNFWF